ncbi:hypothetical protein EKH57_07325 [Halorubrum sp. BOL3-1]|uniref:hypothetical protein n=1 Tax=Halorubrum sp. BOL3-1 TaxID=2497325 RepID=UPI001004E4E6|nr:hypothetical protein [Halorubrum sp. BOL3-1]QAU12550.1 hypothetical protein EKH57_07325 [Halorubrum sp. BOL3-1]
MPSRSRRALLAAVGAGFAGGLAGCSARIGDLSTARTSPNDFDVGPHYVADGVPLPDGADPRTVEDPAAGRIALFPSDERDRPEPLAALRGSTPVVIVGRNAQVPLMDLCAADGRPYGFANNGWGPETRVAAAVPSEAGLVTHVFEGVEVPSGLAAAVDRVLDPQRTASAVDTEPSDRPTGFNEGARTIGASYVHGRNGVAAFTRRDAVRVAGDANRTHVELELRGTIHGGESAGGNGAYAADQVRLVASFDDDVRSTAPPAGETAGLVVRRVAEETGDAVDHRFTQAGDGVRPEFTACQRSLVTVAETPDPFSYVGNARFRWRDQRILREDNLWHHHTPGRAVWYPDGGRSV